MKLITAIVLLLCASMASAQLALPPRPMFMVPTNQPPRRTPAITLAWRPSADTNVTGYNIYYGMASRIYTNKLDVGNVLTGAVSNLVLGATYYFAATAYNLLGLESDYSNEVSYTIPIPTPTTNIITITVVSGIESAPDILHSSFCIQHWFTNSISVTNPPGSQFYRGVLQPVQIVNRKL